MNYAPERAVIIESRSGENSRLCSPFQLLKCIYHFRQSSISHKHALWRATHADASTSRLATSTTVEEEDEDDVIATFMMTTEPEDEMSVVDHPGPSKSLDLLVVASCGQPSCHRCSRT